LEIHTSSKEGIKKGVLEKERLPRNPDGLKVWVESFCPRLNFNQMESLAEAEPRKRGEHSPHLF
jgi:hypothetical protein